MRLTDLYHRHPFTRSNNGSRTSVNMSIARVIVVNNSLIVKGGGRYCQSVRSRVRDELVDTVTAIARHFLKAITVQR